jgi:hypothetical protein
LIAALPLSQDARRNVFEGFQPLVPICEVRIMGLLIFYPIAFCTAPPQLFTKEILKE